MRTDNVRADGSFSGYASLFDRIDLGRDRVAPGAFADAIARRGAGGIRMLFQHDPGTPIGRWENITEDQRGLKVSGRIATDSPKGLEVLALLRAGAIDGLSIGFRTLRSTRDPRSRIRTIQKADLWEISIVTFPMLPQARVSEVKHDHSNRSRPLPTVRAFERWLTRDAGLSRREAKTVIADGYAALTGMRDAAPPSDAMADRLRHLTETLHQGGRP